MRPTPETDALDCELHNPKIIEDRYSTMLDHARRLERERDEAREALQRIADCDWVIQRLAGRDWVITLPDSMDAVKKIARDALLGPNKEKNK